jgi:hypothetical protein
MYYITLYMAFRSKRKCLINGMLLPKSKCAAFHRLKEQDKCKVEKDGKTKCENENRGFIFNRSKFVEPEKLIPTEIDKVVGQGITIEDKAEFEQLEFDRFIEEQTKKVRELEKEKKRRANQGFIRWMWQLHMDFIGGFFNLILFPIKPIFRGAAELGSLGVLTAEGRVGEARERLIKDINVVSNRIKAVQLLTDVAALGIGVVGAKNENKTMLALSASLLLASRVTDQGLEKAKIAGDILKATEVIQGKDQFIPRLALTQQKKEMMQTIIDKQDDISQQELTDLLREIGRSVEQEKADMEEQLRIQFVRDDVGDVDLDDRFDDDNDDDDDAPIQRINLDDFDDLENVPNAPVIRNIPSENDIRRRARQNIQRNAGIEDIGDDDSEIIDLGLNEDEELNLIIQNKDNLSKGEVRGLLREIGPNKKKNKLKELISIREKIQNPTELNKPIQNPLMTLWEELQETKGKPVKRTKKVIIPAESGGQFGDDIPSREIDVEIPEEKQSKASKIEDKLVDMILGPSIFSNEKERAERKANKKFRESVEKDFITSEQLKIQNQSRADKISKDIQRKENKDRKKELKEANRKKKELEKEKRELEAKQNAFKKSLKKGGGKRVPRVEFGDLSLPQLANERPINKKLRRRKTRKPVSVLGEAQQDGSFTNVNRQIVLNKFEERRQRQQQADDEIINNAEEFDDADEPSRPPPPPRDDDDLEDVDSFLDRVMIQRQRQQQADEDILRNAAELKKQDDIIRRLEREEAEEEEEKVDDDEEDEESPQPVQPVLRHPLQPSQPPQDDNDDDLDLGGITGGDVEIIGPSNDEIIRREIQRQKQREEAQPLERATAEEIQRGHGKNAKGEFKVVGRNGPDGLIWERVYLNKNKKLVSQEILDKVSAEMDRQGLGIEFNEEEIKRQIRDGTDILTQLQNGTFPGQSKNKETRGRKKGGKKTGGRKKGSKNKGNNRGDQEDDIVNNSNKKVDVMNNEQDKPENLAVTNQKIVVNDGKSPVDINFDAVARVDRIKRGQNDDADDVKENEVESPILPDQFDAQQGEAVEFKDDRQEDPDDLEEIRTGVRPISQPLTKEERRRYINITNSKIPKVQTIEFIDRARELIRNTPETLELDTKFEPQKKFEKTLKGKAGKKVDRVVTIGKRKTSLQSAKDLAEEIDDKIKLPIKDLPQLESERPINKKLRKKTRKKVDVDAPLGLKQNKEKSVAKKDLIKQSRIQELREGATPTEFERLAGTSLETDEQTRRLDKKVAPQSFKQRGEVGRPSKGLNVKELKAEAKKRGLKGYSKMNKKELNQLLSSQPKQTQPKQTQPEQTQPEQKPGANPIELRSLSSSILDCMENGGSYEDCLARGTNNFKIIDKMTKTQQNKFENDVIEMHNKAMQGVFEDSDSDTEEILDNDVEEKTKTPSPKKKQKPKPKSPKKKKELSEVDDLRQKISSSGVGVFDTNDVDFLRRIWKQIQKQNKKEDDTE